MCYEFAFEQNDIINFSDRFDDIKDPNYILFRFACYLKNINLIPKYLNEQDLNINSKTDFGNTLLIIAAYNNKLDVVNFLLNQPDIDINTTNNQNETALSCTNCKKFKNLLLEKLNIDNKAIRNCKNLDKNDIDKINKKGITGLMRAVCKNNTKLVKKYIEYSANVNFQDSEGITSLMIAASESFDTITKILIEAGANINMVNNNGETALMCAVGNENKKIVEILVDAGSDINIVDKDGDTAISISHEKHLPILLQKK
jgi:ankyrin repeat protein